MLAIFAITKICSSHNAIPLYGFMSKICIMVLWLNEDRLLKVVMLAALERGSKIKWVQNLKQSLEMFGRGAVCAKDL